MFMSSLLRSLGGRALLLAVLLFMMLSVRAQNPELPPKASKFKEPSTAGWINTYGNIRVSDRLFWIAQTHFRFVGTEDTPHFGEVGQLYNRHAISYLFTKKFRASVGGVLRVNFNTGGVGEGEKRAVPEWRIWHEYLWAIPVDRLYFYHRVRLEHRWTQGFQPNDDYIYRNRWRYMISAKIPLNKPKMGPHVFYIGPEAELIMQSGKAVVGSPLEDLRLHTSFGYIATPRLTFAAGLMYSLGQELIDGATYKQKWTTRIHMYFSPDWRKIKNKLPAIHRNE